MASLVAPVGEDGKLQTQLSSSDSVNGNSKNSNSMMDSDMFLKLLVAEMKYQDPLEPTSNTEWVAQYATFTQVQKMGEMADSVDLLRANDLVGKEVIMKVTSEKTGDVTYTKGMVDYITVEKGKPVIWIGDKKYSMADLDTVVSPEYSKAYDKYDTLTGMLKGLPDIKYADRSYANVIKGAYKYYYNEMDEYDQEFMSTYGADLMTVLETWKAQLTKLGVDFKDIEPTVKKEITLEDIMESFNTKMNAVIEKMDLLAKNQEAKS